MSHFCESPTENLTKLACPCAATSKCCSQKVRCECPEIKGC
uniref:Uncharacterized protein n=1 Tax=Anguilla anguilla TaxID=7936 RepID=A0A0E9TTR9_ANGAN